MNFLSDMIMTIIFKGSRFYCGETSVETAAKQRWSSRQARHCGIIGKENERNGVKLQENVSGRTMPCGHFYMIMIIFSEWLWTTYRNENDIQIGMILFNMIVPWKASFRNDAHFQIEWSWLKLWCFYMKNILGFHTPAGVCSGCLMFKGWLFYMIQIKHQTVG